MLSALLSAGAALGLKLRGTMASGARLHAAWLKSSRCFAAKGACYMGTFRTAVTCGGNPAMRLRDRARGVGALETVTVMRTEYAVASAGRTAPKYKMSCLQTQFILFSAIRDCSEV
jgi:hypothetical protein